MNSFESIRINGVDETRPPRIRKEAYIDLYFRMSCEAPEEWCEDFNVLGRQIVPAAKIDKNSRLIIDTYVNDMNNIPAHLAELKLTVDDMPKSCDNGNWRWPRKMPRSRARSASSSGSTQSSPRSCSTTERCSPGPGPNAAESIISSIPCALRCKVRF